MSGHFWFRFRKALKTGRIEMVLLVPKNGLLQSNLFLAGFVLLVNAFMHAIAGLIFSRWVFGDVSESCIEFRGVIPIQASMVSL